ncbi:MAG: glucan biosynthesis protein, partial [Alphaproteobacteria bacterium]|nr:glucan biosynthesis protein [Alphaproteobacteria bacterium]
MRKPFRFALIVALCLGAPSIAGHTTGKAAEPAATESSTAERPLQGEPLQGEPGPFTFATVKAIARKTASKPFSPTPELDAIEHLPQNYDEYRRMRFRTERALWRSVPPQFEIHPLPVGWLFKQPIELFVVSNGEARRVSFKVEDFEDERKVPLSSDKWSSVPLSGFRINGPLNNVSRSDEIIVFQGASYFRALGKGHLYGLSARGLANRTASPKGEEFAMFTRFWIVRPENADSSQVTVYALLDGKSVSGAYRFVVTPGDETVTEVEAVLFPRLVMEEVGIAPLTSMHL